MSNIAPPPKKIAYLIGHGGIITALHFTNETDDVIRIPSLISGSDKGEIFVWNLETQRVYHRIAGHDKKTILYLCYYKSSLISHGRDGNIHVWKFTNDKWSIINSFNSSSYGFCSSDLFLTESTTYLVVPTEDNSLTFYDYETSKFLRNSTYERGNKGNENETCICMKIFTEKMKIFILMGYDSGCISLWDFESNQEVSRLKCHPEIMLCFDYDSKYKNRGISGSVDDKLQVWKKTEVNELVKIHEVPVTNPGIQAIKIRDDGKIVLTAGQDGNIRIFSWKSLKPIAVLTCHREPITSLQCRIEPFGKKQLLVFASGAKDKNICISAVFF